MITRQSRHILLAAVAVLSLSVAACSTSGSDSNSTGSNAGTATGSASGSGSGNELVIGDIGSYSGTLASTEGAIPKVLNAWVQAVNAAGGLNGHKVRLITQDVGTTTGAGLTAAQTLITQNHVAAIIDFDGNDATWIKYAASQHVPVVTGYASIASLLSPDAFSVITSPIALAYGLAAQSKVLGSKTAIGYASETAEAGQIVALTNTFGRSLGLNLAVAAKMSSSLPDYTAFCQQLKSSGVDSYSLAFSSATSQKITDQCHQQGVKIPQLAIGPSVAPSWRTDSAYNGDYAIDGVAPFFDTSLPAVKAYRDALTKYEPGIVGGPLDNSTGLFAWAAAQLIATVAPKVSGTITAQSLLAQLFKVKNETLGGLVAPLTYSSAKATSINCYFVWRISGGKYVVSNGVTPVCAPASAIAPIDAGFVKSIGG